MACQTLGLSGSNPTVSCFWPQGWLRVKVKPRPEGPTVGVVLVMPASVLGLLISLRTAGVERIPNETALHLTLRALLSEGVEVEGKPVPHPLFGYYVDMDDAISEACRSGVLDYILPRGGLLFGIDAPSARRLVTKWGVSDELMAKFAAHYLRVTECRGA